MTMAGMHESRTRERSHPFTKAIMKPPKKVETSCMNFPTCHFSMHLIKKTEKTEWRRYSSFGKHFYLFVQPFHPWHLGWELYPLTSFRWPLRSLFPYRKMQCLALVLFSNTNLEFLWLVFLQWPSNMTPLKWITFKSQILKIFICNNVTRIAYIGLIYMKLNDYQSVYAGRKLLNLCIVHIMVQKKKLLYWWKILSNF